MTITIQNAFLKASIKSKGAELISLKATNNKEYIWNADPAFWGKHSPVLFPIVGTLKDNSYYYENIEYSLSRHGFARDMDFILVSKTENSAVFSLQATQATLAIFPFDFELKIAYTLIAKQLKITYTVINNGSNVMPFSIGAHPAFALPNSFENYSLEFEHQEELNSYVLENDLLSNITIPIEMTNKKVALSYSLFEKDALIFKKIKSKKISILENESILLQLSFSDFPHLGIWTKKNAQFLCIEPWTGYSDVINASQNILEKESIQFLERNTTFTCGFGIEIY